MFTQFLSNVMHRLPIQARRWRRAEALVHLHRRCRSTSSCASSRITNGAATRRIFNIGNPENCVSVAELARRIVRIAAGVPAARRACPGDRRFRPSHSQQYYGEGYQDIQMRVPAIAAARDHLGWSPTTDLDSAIRKTISRTTSRRARAWSPRSAHRGSVPMAAIVAGWR